MALIALLGITYMNIHYVNQVKESTKDSIVEKKREQIRSFANQVRQRFLEVPREIWKFDVEEVKQTVDKTGMLPESLNPLMQKILSDSLYSGIYFHSAETTPCESGTGTWEFNREINRFEWVNTFPDVVCDGMSLARTRMKVLLSDYKWNTKTTFDTHRSMNIAIMYPDEHRVLGYLVVLINFDYLLDTYLKQEIESVFKADAESFTIWVHDWVTNRVLLSNSETNTLERDKIQIVDRFPGLFDNWNILGSVNSTVSAADVEVQTTKNLIILALSVALLLTSLVFIIYSAQKEQEISVRQSEFLSNVTHELKTPLAVIQAAGENIKDGRVKNEERLHYYGKHIYDEAIRLKTMIERLLDVARFDANQIKAQPQAVFVDAKIQEIIERELPVLQSKGFDLKLDLNAANQAIWVDMGHFETILTNLIENAVKYSPAQKFLGIRTSVGHQKMKISVEDHGSGIPKPSLPHIFEKFYRVEDTLTAHTKGHGLGLAIVKQMIESNKGSIHVESEYQKGSIFTIELPLAEQDLSSQKKTSKQQQKQAHYVTSTAESVV